MDTRIKEILKKISIFSGLEDNQLEVIAGICRIKDVQEQEELFKEGDPGQDLFILLEGRVNIEIQLKLKSEKATVHTVGEGEIFGEFALVDGEARSASATSVKKGKVMILTKEQLEQAIIKDPQIGYLIMKNFNKVLCGRIRKTTRELRTSLMWD